MIVRSDLKLGLFQSLKTNAIRIVKSVMATPESERQNGLFHGTNGSDGTGGKMAALKIKTWKIFETVVNQFKKMQYYTGK